MNYKPSFELQANNNDITRTLMERVGSVQIVQHCGFISDHCILELDDHHDSRIQLPSPGDTVRIKLGYKKGDSGDKSEMVEHGIFEVGEYSLSGPRDTMFIYGNKFQWSSAALKAPKQRSWPSTVEEPKTLQDLLGAIAGEHGLEAKVSSELASIVMPAIEQSESDLQLITKLGLLYDATARIVETFLIFMPRGTGRSRSGGQIPSIAIDIEQMMRWDIVDSQLPAYESCKASYHDLTTALRMAVTAGTGDPCYELTYPLADEVTAQWAAKARLNDFKRTSRTLKADVIGDAKLMAGGSVEISDVREGIDGSWFITKVHHLIDSNGFTSTIECEQILG
ncbi:MAG: phage protein D [Phenylobacterium sp.]|jgi:phage protein D